MEPSMDVGQTANRACVVCGRRSAHRASWYLAIENSRLDGLKIFVWHPALAERSAMHSVCSPRHLELLITHWLTYANLRFEAASMTESVLADHGYWPGEGINLPHPGQLVGELTVYREHSSGHWMGSAEARESIFEALRTAREAQVGSALQNSAEEKPVPPEFAVALPDRTVLAGDYVGAISTA